jgi:peroxiredoxin
LPSLENLHGHFSDKPFVLLTIDVQEKSSVVKKFMDKKGYTMPALLDSDGKVSELYGVRSHPMKFLVNKSGKLIGIAKGYREWDVRDMKHLIQTLMSTKG